MTKWPADSSSVHHGRCRPVFDDRVGPPGFAHHQPRWIGRLRSARRRGPGLVVAGGDRHRRIQVFPQGRRSPDRRRRQPGPRRRRATRSSVPRPRAARSSIVSPAPGAGGARNYGYFASADDAQAYEDEMKYMLANQIASPNSPQWFNTGLAHAYGITGTPQGFWYVDPVTGEMTESPDSYTHPAPHACFINGVSDDLVNPGGIMDLWVREARLFKMGSGTGSNFSQIRAENETLSGGGKSSGRHGLPSHRRSRRWRHQERRHHPSRRQDGHPRSRPSRRRRVHRLEDARGGEGPHPHQPWRICRRLQRRGLRHRLRAELQQLGAGTQRVHRSRPQRRRLATARAHHGQGPQDPQGPRPLAQGRRGRLGLRRPRRPVRHHHQRVAHLPGRRKDPGHQPLRRIRLPRQHRLQPRLDQPRQVLRRRLQRLRYRGLRARHSPLDHHARDLGGDGPLPVEGDRPGLLRLPHPRPWLRQPRNAPHADGSALRLRRRSGCVRVPSPPSSPATPMPRRPSSPPRSAPSLDSPRTGRRCCG